MSVYIISVYAISKICIRKQGHAKEVYVIHRESYPLPFHSLQLVYFPLKFTQFTYQHQMCYIIYHGSLMEVREFCKNLHGLVLLNLHFDSSVVSLGNLQAALK